MRIVVTMAVGHSMLCCGMALAAATAQPVGLSDFFQVREASNPAIAPDGSQVAYVLRTPDIRTDAQQTAVHVVNLRSQEDVSLSKGSQRSWQPTWSPSGDRLAFVQANAGRFHIMIAGSITGTVETLTEVPSAPVELTWSPDGRQLAFMASTPLAVRQPLASEPPQGATWAKPATVVTAGGFQSVAALLPGPTEVFLYVTDAREGSVPRRVTEKALGRALPYTGAGLAWSRDGKRIITSLNLSPNSWLNMMAGAIYAIDVATGNIQKVASDRTGSHHPEVASDGSLAFQCMEHGHGIYFDRKLCVGPGESGPFAFLAERLDRPIGSTVWAPDARGIYGVYQDEGVAKVAYFGRNGTIEVLATTGGGDASSYTSGGSISVARNGTVAFAFSDGASPSEIAIVRRGQQPRVITRVNADYLSNRVVNPSEEIRYRTSDQLPGHGWVVKPAGFDARRRYPTIVLLHGGQSSDFGPDFDLIPQIFAAHGYVVVMPNYRGSGSYGTAFGDTVDYPIGIDRDVLASVDALIAAGVTDPERLFIVGGSGGGLSTGWTIGHSTRFRAAVMWYPPTEMYSYVLDAATGPTTMRGTFTDRPWKTPNDYLARSPLSHVESVTTPTMLIVGSDDRITPVSQSIIFFTALQLRGVPSELLVYPGEPHGIRVHPSHSASVVAETLGWFARHGSGQSLARAEFGPLAPSP